MIIETKVEIDAQQLEYKDGVKKQIKLELQRKLKTQLNSGSVTQSRRKHGKTEMYFLLRCKAYGKCKCKCKFIVEVSNFVESPGKHFGLSGLLQICCIAIQNSVPLTLSLLCVASKQK